MALTHPNPNQVGNELMPANVPYDPSKSYWMHHMPMTYKQADTIRKYMQIRGITDKEIATWCGDGYVSLNRLSKQAGSWIIQRLIDSYFTDGDTP